MDIKDSYLHSTVGVVKSISADADKLKYTLADVAGTVKEVTLPIATTSANGLMSSGDKTKLDNLSSTIGNYVTLDTDQEITGTKTFTKQQKFTVAKGTAPFQVTSDTLVTNLNADLLDGLDSKRFLRSVNRINNQDFNATDEIDKNGYCYYNTNYVLSADFQQTNAPYAYGMLTSLNSEASGMDFAVNGSLDAPVGLKFRKRWLDKYSEWKTIAFTDSDITGNASSATKLQTSRKLWGQDFDGTADVSGDMTGVGNVTGTNSLWRITKVGDEVYLQSKTANGGNNGNIVLSGYNVGNAGKITLFANTTLINGNVGIGTTSPRQKLEVSGGVRATSFIGNLDGTYVNTLTDYTKASSSSAIAATDSLNTALGKLEYKADIACDWITSVTAEDTDELVNKWGEIVDFLDSVAEGTDITDEFVTRKTNQTITGLKTFYTSAGNIKLEDAYVKIDMNLYGDWARGLEIINTINSKTVKSTFGAYGHGDEDGNNVLYYAFISHGSQGYDNATLKIYDNKATISNNEIYHKGNLKNLSDLNDDVINGKYLPLTGGKLTGNLTLSVAAANTDSPKLIFERAGSNNSYYDWQQYVSTGHMLFTCDNNGSHEERIRFVDKGGILINGNTVLHEGNYTSYLPFLNSTSTHATKSSVIYAPTSGGTQGQILTSSGSDAPTWINQSSLTAGKAAVADKLSVDTGSSTEPVYFANGVPVVCNSLNIRRTYVIDLQTSIKEEDGTTFTFDRNKFYPVLFDPYIIETDCEIISPALNADADYNQNAIHFLLKKCGWTDTPYSFKVLSYGLHTTNEVTIGAIGVGTKTGYQCVWLRGGMKYTFYSNKKPILKHNDYTYGATDTEVYTVGTNYHGGQNSHVSIIWQALDRSKEVAVQSEIPTKVSQLTNDSGFLTQHQSLSNYVTLNGTQTITGVKTFSTQQKFTVAQGTSPFTVTSTTKVSNLNSDLLDGYDSSRFLRAKDWITYPGQDADTLEQNMMCFTYSNNAPHAGTIIYFSGATGGHYGLQLNASYSSSGYLSFRSRNGDSRTWKDWSTILTQHNYTDYINTTNFPGLNEVGTVTQVIAGTGISVSATTANQSTYTVTNAGVRATTINGNYLRVNTNGTNADLTIPYATTASQLNNTSVSDPSTAASGQNVKWYSQINNSSGYAGTNYGFPVSNDANGILWLGTHSGPYGWQMGFSSTGRIYARYISNNSFSTTANGGSWNRIAWISDIPAVTNYYWADIKVSNSSSTTTTPTFAKWTNSDLNLLMLLRQVPKTFSL